jgi:glucan phosphorylase
VDQEEYPYHCEGKRVSMYAADAVSDELMWLQMGKFSSDRAINDYAQEYWNVEPQKLT